MWERPQRPDCRLPGERTPREIFSDQPALQDRAQTAHGRQRDRHQHPARTTLGHAERRNELEIWAEIALLFTNARRESISLAESIASTVTISNFGRCCYSRGVERKNIGTSQVMCSDYIIAREQKGRSDGNVAKVVNKRSTGPGRNYCAGHQRARAGPNGDVVRLHQPIAHRSTTGTVPYSEIGYKNVTTQRKIPAQALSLPLPTEPPVKSSAIVLARVWVGQQANTAAKMIGKNLRAFVFIGSLSSFCANTSFSPSVVV
jgi:hypothetical protein